MSETTVLKGTVIRGADRGKSLGFPTANLDIPSRDLPQTGVYAVWVRIQGDQNWHRGAAHVGSNLTFSETTKKLEVYLLAFSGDLYGRTLEVVPVGRLRPEKRFRSADALIRQMRRDCRRAARMLASKRFASKHPSLKKI